MKIVGRPHATATTCPFCRENLHNTTSIAACSVCHTVHHISCWKENGSCSVYGCRGTFIAIEHDVRPIHRRRKKIFYFALILWLPFMLMTAILSYAVFKLPDTGIGAVCSAVTVAYVLILARLNSFAFTCPACHYS